MITPQDIHKKASRKYPDFLRHLIEREPAVPFFPLTIPFTKFKASADYTLLQKTIKALQAQAKPPKSSSYTIEWHTTQTRQYGQQTLPHHIYFATQNDYIRFLGKQSEVKQFRIDVNKILTTFPQLQSWVMRSPQQVITHSDRWPELLRVCRYFVTHPRPRRYIRELPIDVHTKFIEQNSKILRTLLDQLLPDNAINHESTRFTTRYYLREPESLVRMRLLDPQIQTELGWPTADLAIPVSSLAENDLSAYRFFIIENLMTFLTFPSSPQSIALWGQGNGVLQLKSAAWLDQATIYYWGDIDVQGFEILSSLRSHFPAVQAIMMDKPTWAKHQPFVVSGTPSKRREHPTHLHLAESDLYQELHTENKRLEQERIHQSYINQVMERFHLQ